MRSGRSARIIHRSRRKYAESEPIYRRVLALFEARQQSGDADAEYEIAVNLNNLAAVYTRTGRAAQAEPLYRRTLALKEKSLGAENPDVAVTLNIWPCCSKTWAGQTKPPKRIAARSIFSSRRSRPTIRSSKCAARRKLG